jgi:two-component sensor histidine kinase/CheY-like chemotaxis protein
MMHRIINVDDTPALRYAKGKVLRQAGFTVSDAANGREALDLIEKEKPDLVLLDVKLPDMSGHEVCQIVKRTHPGTMVIQVSASFVESTDRVRGLELGADAYLAEPLSPEELIANVHALLRLKDAEAQKELALQQKELLFRELNHRVKNNLQLISSLLSIQSRRITDPAAREEFRTAQQRVRAIASLHARLYQSADGIDSVEMHHYLRELVDQLRALLLAERRDVDLKFDCDEFTVNVDRATSIGLIVNELVSNAAKHAFATGGGTIAVALRVESGTCILRVTDDGNGKSAGDQDPGVGLKLVGLFAAQLDGTVAEESDRGLRVTVRFPLQREAGRSDPSELPVA